MPPGQGKLGELYWTICTGPPGSGPANCERTLAHVFAGSRPQDAAQYGTGGA